MTTYFIWEQMINFSKILSVLARTLFFIIWKLLLKPSSSKRITWNRKSIISFYHWQHCIQKTIVLRGFFDKIPSKLKKVSQKKNHQIQKKAAVELEILSVVIVVNANQRLLMQKAYAAWIKKKFLKIISKLYLLSFWKYFCSVMR